MSEAISKATPSGAMSLLGPMAIDRDGAQGRPTSLAYRHPLITRATFLAEIARHQEQDKVLRGTYWDYEKGKGCAIGCAFSSIANVTDGLIGPDTRDNHRLLSEYLRIDEDLLRVEDFLFEKLPESRAATWPLEFSSAIPAGADTSGVANALVAAVLRNLYAPASDEPPEWTAIARRVADGIDAGRQVGDWLNLRTEFPNESWSLPQRAVTYLLANLRGRSFLTTDALSNFLLHAVGDAPAAAEWMADTLLILLRDAPIGIAEAA